MLSVRNKKPAANKEKISENLRYQREIKVSPQIKQRTIRKKNNLMQLNFQTRALTRFLEKRSYKYLYIERKNIYLSYNNYRTKDVLGNFENILTSTKLDFVVLLEPKYTKKGRKFFKFRTINPDSVGNIYGREW